MADGKEILVSHYNKRYKYGNIYQFESKEVMIKGYPKDRYEAAVYWGKGNGKALEIAAGSGEVLMSLSQYYDEYVATELAKERAKYLKKLTEEKTHIKIIQNDIEEKNLDFPPEYFDTIIMVAVIEHLIEPISVIRYCYSLLKPGGKIIVHTLNIAKWTRRLKLLFGFFPSTGSLDEGFFTYDGKLTDLYDEGHLRYFTFRSLRKLLKDRGAFREVKDCGHGNTFLSRLWPGLFSECCVIGIK